MGKFCAAIVLTGFMLLAAIHAFYVSVRPPVGTGEYADYLSLMHWYASIILASAAYLVWRWAVDQLPLEAVK